MTVPRNMSSATPAHDTPTIESVSSLCELQAVLTRPRATGDPLLTVLLEGAAAAQILGEGIETVAAAVTEEVSA